MKKPAKKVFNKKQSYRQRKETAKKPLPMTPSKKMGLFAIVGGALGVFALVAVVISGLSFSQTAINSDGTKVLGSTSPFSSIFGGVSNKLTYPKNIHIQSTEASALYGEAVHNYIKWDQVEGAIGYIIYRKEYWLGFVREIASVIKYDRGFGDQSYTDTNVTVGKKYYYRVAAYNYDSSGKRVAGQKSVMYSIVTKGEDLQGTGSPITGFSIIQADNTLYGPTSICVRFTTGQNQNAAGESITASVFLTSSIYFHFYLEDGYTYGGPNYDSKSYRIADKDGLERWIVSDPALTSGTKLEVFLTKSNSAGEEIRHSDGTLFITVD